MKKISFLLFIFTLVLTCAGQTLTSLPIWNEAEHGAEKKDWLVSPIWTKAAVYRSADGKDIILFNGLVRRIFRLRPNVACIDFRNLSNGQQLLRAIGPEARITIDNVKYDIGGLHGQTEKAYLVPEWLDRFGASGRDFQFAGMVVEDIKPFIAWKPRGWVMNDQQPTGKMISMVFKSPLPAARDIVVTVHYELYDGIPLIVKWVSVSNQTKRSILLNRMINEVLAVVEEESAVVGSPEQMKKQHGLYVESNYAFNNAMRYDISDQTTHWETDSSYTSQVNYGLQTPCLLEIYPEKVTGVEIPPQQVFNSIRSYELLLDSYDRERRGLAIRSMYRKVAPWTTENPIFMHLVSTNDQEVKNAVDQCAATGYEALILSFGSHCNIEDTTPENINKWKALSQYAHQKKIMIGGYSLFSSRRISPQDDVIDPQSGKPDAAAFFGAAPCMGSSWGLGYLARLETFLLRTGFDILENDGPYPGDLCASVTHPGHKNLDDSQWKQLELQKGLYHWCSRHGIYVNAPDWYFLDGTNKIAIGYREVNFSLPRSDQKILNRQNIFDGLWEKTPAMSWGFVPLTKYQGGGPESVLEPLSQHLSDYRQLMMQYYGAGVQACYRGPRLYDNEQTKQVVVAVIKWYKKYRRILNSDIIHLRRADGRDWDGIMHVNSRLKTKALIMLFNPVDKKIRREITIPLYYADVGKNISVREKEGKAKRIPVNAAREIHLWVDLGAEDYSWFVIE